jgi:hypothetical protein
VPWNPNIPPEIRTVHLGQFTLPHAVELGERLDEAGIWWWTKEPGFLSRIWQLGIEVFVDRTRLDEARELASGVIDPSG